jgi:hypothetical protein
MLMTLPILDSCAAESLAADDNADLFGMGRFRGAPNGRKA